MICAPKSWLSYLHRATALHRYITGPFKPLTVPAWLALAVSVVLAGVAQAGDMSVLIVNSDRSLSKYAQLEDSFEDNLQYSTYAVDLGSEAINEKRLKTVISRYDPEIIFSVGSPAYQVLSEFRNDRVVVASSVIDWSRLPVGDQTYIIYNEPHIKTQMVTLRYFFPEIRRLGVLYSEEHSGHRYRQMMTEAVDKRFQVTGYELGENQRVESVVDAMLSNVDAVYFIADPMVMKSEDQIIHIYQKCDKHQTPVFAYDPIFTAIGATLIISVDIPTMGRQAANVVSDILESRPVAKKRQEPIGSEITLNMKKVRDYGIMVNRDALRSVDRIIE